jgi:DNA-binding transcriptional MerR regulator
VNKSPDAFRTISEAAEELDLPQHVLRFWETRFTQIKPMKRGGGRRYYRPADVDLLKGIRHLLYDKGYTIRGVQRILREEGIPHAVAIGRGEIDAGPQTSDSEAADTQAPKPSSAEASEAAAPTAPTLSEGQVRELRLAMEDLEAARQLLGGA